MAKQVSNEKAKKRDEDTKPQVFGVTLPFITLESVEAPRRWRGMPVVLVRCILALFFGAKKLFLFVVTNIPFACRHVAQSARALHAAPRRHGQSVFVRHNARHARKMSKEKKTLLVQNEDNAWKARRKEKLNDVCYNFLFLIFSNRSVLHLHKPRR